MPVAANAAPTSLEEAFALGEASMGLEGLDPKADPVYRSLKADVLSGTIGFDEAVRLAIRSTDDLKRNPAA